MVMVDDCIDGGIGSGLRNRRLSILDDRNVSSLVSSTLYGAYVEYEYMLMPLSSFINGYRYNGFFDDDVEARPADAWSGVDFECRSACEATVFVFVF